MIVRLLRRVVSLSSAGPLFFLASILVPLGVALYLIVFASPPVPTTSAVLSTINNVVEVQGVNDDSFQRAQVEQVLVAGDGVRTSQQGRGVITFADESNIVLEPDSELTILAPQRRGAGIVNRFSQSFGTSWSQFSSVARGGGNYEIRTPAGIVSVRDGAILRVGVGRNAEGVTTVQVVVLQGQAEIRPSGAAPSAAAVVVNAGQTATSTEGAGISQPEAFVPDNDVVLRLFSPFWMIITEPGTGLATGLVPPGAAVFQIPLSTTTSAGREPQEINLNELVTGTYTIYLLPKRTGGDFRVTAGGRALGEAIFSDERRGSTTGCDWLYLLLHVDLDADGLLKFGELQGPFFLSSLPQFFARGVESDCPPPRPITAQVAGVQATGTPPPANTPVPTAVPTSPPPEPTEAPPPTSAPPTRAPPTVAPPTEIPFEVEIPTPPPPTEIPQPTPPPRPNIDIGPVEEGVLGSLRPVPVLLASLPGLALALAGVVRRRRGGPP